MSNISVNFKSLGSAHTQSILVVTTMRIRDFRVFAQTMLNFDDSKCRIIVERTEEDLEDYQSFEEACIQSGDVLLLIPIEAVKPSPNLRTNSSDSTSGFQQIKSNPATASNQAQAVVYKLILTPKASGQEAWEYSVQIEECYENNPQFFYSDFGGCERDKFADFLKTVLKKSIGPKDVDRILNLWCNDIVQGYRTTRITL
jgi:hypothetical protein